MKYLPEDKESLAILRITGAVGLRVGGWATIKVASPSPYTGQKVVSLSLYFAKASVKLRMVAGLTKML